MGLSSFLGKMVGSGVGTLAKDLAGIVDTFVETPEEKAAASIILMKAQQEPDKWQAEINKIQAGHRTMFVAGARPFLMWVCGTGLAFVFVINPIIQWITGKPGPDMPLDYMMEIVYLMLGMGALRTYEKKEKISL